MHTTIDDLREEWPQSRFTIDKMTREGKTFEEIEDHIHNLDETD